jgi:ATP phosphoribosyltransferase
MTPLKIALPNGHLQEETSRLLKTAGFAVKGYNKGTRDYRPVFEEGGLEAKVFRPQEIPLVVAEGYYDIGISGQDWLLESRCEDNVEDMLDLGIGRVDVALAVPAKWDKVNTADDLFQLPLDNIRIWTEYLNLAREFVARKTNVEPKVRSPWENVGKGGWSKICLFLSFGVTEAKPPEDAEAIIDNTSTGATLKANSLKIIDRVLENSTARLIANRLSLRHPEKGKAIEAIAARLRAVVPTSRRRGTTPTFGHI